MEANFCSRRRTQAEDHQLTGNQHLGNDFLVSAALEIGAGMDRVFAGPASRGKQRVQAIRVGPLIGVGDHLAAQFAVLGSIRYSSLDYSGIKGSLQGGTELLDLSAGKTAGCLKTPVAQETREFRVDSWPPRPHQDLLHGRLGDSWTPPSVEFRQPNKGSSPQNVSQFLGILLLGLKGVRRRGENPTNCHREAKVTAPLLDSNRIAFWAGIDRNGRFSPVDRTLPRLLP